MPRQPLRSLVLDLLPRAGVPLHTHQRHQFAIGDGGAFTVLAENRIFVVAQGQGIYIPAGIEHAIMNRMRTRLHGVYLTPAPGDRMPEVCTVCQLSPLLRELVRAAAGLHHDYDGDSPSGRLAAVIIDQLADLSADDRLSLPMPRDKRLTRIASALAASPGDRRSLAAWGRRAGASPRTLSRLFQAETGMGFDAWRARLRVATAIGWLAEGRRIGDVAYALGYDSPSAFISMFRRTAGIAPGKYLERIKHPE